MSLANQLRILKAYSTAVTTQIGVGFASALRHVIIFLNAVAKRALQAAQAFAIFMQTLFGKYKGGAKGVNMDLGGIGDDLGDIGGGGGGGGSDLADSTGQAADNLGDAAANAKELKEQLSVLPFDELNQLAKPNEAADSSGSGGAGGAGDGGGGIGGLGDIGGGLLDIEDLIDSSEIPDKINRWANLIKNAFLGHNWYALGRDVAQAMNAGMQYLYDLFDPENVKKYIVPFITHFTAAFNAWVDTFDWDLFGRLLGRMLNDIILMFNTFIESINAIHLGEKLSEAFLGFLHETDFVAFGNALGNKFMFGWDIFIGFVSNEQVWTDLGTAIADGFRGMNEKIRLGDIGTALGEFVNGIATTLGEIAKDDKLWDDLINNIKSGIANFLSTVTWEENAAKLDKFIDRLVDAIVEILDPEQMKKIGQGLAETLAGLDWERHLGRLGRAIVRALGAILKGLISEPEGAVAVGVTAGLAALNIGAGLVRIFGAPALGAAVATGLGKTVKTGIAGIGGALSGVGGAVGSVITGSSFLGGLLDTGFVIGRFKELNEHLDQSESGLMSLKLTTENTAVSFDTLRGAVSYMGEQGALSERQVEGLTKQINKSEESGESLSNALYYTADSVDYYTTATRKGFVQLVDDIATGSDNMGESVEHTTQSTFGKVSDFLGTKFPSVVGTAMKYLGLSVVEGNKKEVEPAVNEVVNELSGAGDRTIRGATLKSTEANSAYAKGLGNTAPIEASVNGLENAVDTGLTNIVNKSEPFGLDVSTKFATGFGNRTELNTQISATQTTVEEGYNAMMELGKVAGEGVFQGIINGMNANLQTLQDNTNAAMETVETAMNIDLFWAGQNAMQSFANGIQSVHIPTPQYYVSGYDLFDIGDSFSYFPRFGVTWYKAGGLFSGGKGQIIGIAESNRDEAVIPLEDQRAMARIGSAIAEASDTYSGGYGAYSEDRLASKIADAISRSPSAQEIIVNAVLKMEDDEVLARHVERGQARMNNRYNPVAVY